MNIDIDFYQHLILATYLFIIILRWIPANWMLYRTERKRTAFMYTMIIAIIWEGAEYFYNRGAYADMKHYLTDTATDLLAAAAACTIIVILFKKDWN